MVRAMTPVKAPIAADFTHARIWGLAGPIILSNATVPLLGLVDTAVAGRLGAEHFIGAVAVGSTVLTLMYWTFGFLRMGTAGLAAQAAGARDDQEVQTALARALLIAGTFGVILIAAQSLLINGLLPLMDASQEVEDWARRYCQIRIWGAPAALASFALIGWFVGLGNTRIVLILQLFQNGVNIVLSLTLGLGLRWGIDGIAIGTLVSEWAVVVVGLFIVWRTVRGRLDLNWIRISDRTAVIRTLAVNRDIMIRSVLLTLAFAWFTREAARIDDVTLAANEVLLKLFELIVYALDGFAFTAEALVGQAVGARARSVFDRAVYMTTFWALICSIIGSLFFWFSGGLLIDLMTDLETVRTMSRDYLIWAALCPFIGIWAFQLDGIFIGATRGVQMRNAMIVSFLIFAAAILILKPAFGNTGLWATMHIFFVVRAATLWWFYAELRRDIETDTSPQAA